MIVVSVIRSSDFISSISIKGHGEMGYGKDLVCAGVSSCFIGALNAIDEPECYHFRTKAGDGLVESLSVPSVHDEIVLETLVIQLKTIEDQYPESIRVKVSRKEG